MIYLDASVLAPTLVREPGSAAVDRFIRANGDRLAVSDLAIGEVYSAMSRRVRMGEMDASAVASLLDAFDSWIAAAVSRIDIAPDDVRAGARIVRRFDLKLLMPDAMHAALCYRRGLKLATFDRRLADACQPLGVVALIPD